jgi:hypothetical protein
MKHLLVQAMALFCGAITSETGSEYAPLTPCLNIYSIDLSAHQLALPLSHTCHTGVDETGVFMKFYTHVETWCDGWKPAVLLERNGSGGGTRTPDTRIMIPLL